LKEVQIIGGKFKGRRFQPIKEKTVRPTAARVREAIFNILSFRVQDAVILDLFAGTGALGLEALSRGAAFAVFIENNRQMISQLAKSISRLDIDAQAKLIRWDISKNLNCLRALLSCPSRAFSPGGDHDASHPVGFNLVFMDPPYNKGLIKKTLAFLNASRTLSNNAVIVIEHDLSESIPKDLLVHRIADQRKYGRTSVSFLEYIGNSDSDPLE